MWKGSFSKNIKQQQMYKISQREKTTTKKKTPLQSIYLTTLKTWIKDKNINPLLDNDTNKVITSPGQQAVKSHQSFLVQPPDAVIK